MPSLFPAEFLARLERLTVRARRPASGMSYGRGKGTSAGSGIEFVDVREYSPGDDLRAVDWNLYARLDKLLVRVFRQEREHDVHVLVDCSRSMGAPDPAKWERAVQLTAAIAYIGLARMDRVAVWPIARGAAAGTPFPLAAGKRRATQLFRYLDALKPEGETDLAAAAEHFVRTAPTRGVAVVISDFYDLGRTNAPNTGSRAGLARLVRGGFEVLAIQVAGAADAAPREHGRLELVDAETGRVIRGRVSAKVRATYDRLLSEERAAIATMLSSAGGAFAIASPDRPLEDILLRDLRRAGVLQ